ncbi:MAG: hypothetical protein Ta2F_06740 [Termitinemataceae bacterium]|nr:MAG: hypothetical protein Ta2F_06740 [Termitinemataceae bacterium]
MPSLTQLKEFQKLMSSIGSENKILADEGIRPDEYALPENEPTPISDVSSSSGGKDLALNADKADKTDSADKADIAVNDLDNLNVEGISDVASPPPPKETAAGDDGADLGDGGNGIDDIFDALGDFAGASHIAKAEVPVVEIPAEAAAELGTPSSEMPPPERQQTEIGQDLDLDLDNMFPDTGGADGEPAAEPDGGTGGDITPDLNLDDLDLGGFDSPSDSSPQDSLPDDTLPAASGGGKAVIAESNVPDSPDNPDNITVKQDLVIPDEDIPTIEGVTDEELSSLAPNEPALEGEGSKPKEPPEQADDVIEPLPNLDDFDIPSLDEEVPKQKKAQPAEGNEKGKGGKKEDKVEAIALSDTELKQLLETIASYPLNLRIACEQVIAEEVVPPAQLSALIKLLVNGGNPRETAALVSKILGKKIQLPKGYKTGEELEEEQSSFTYIFIKRFWPIARVALLIAALAASVTYLSYMFIYKPVYGDMIYKQGYERIEDGEYGRANQLFSKAFGIHKVKKWFYLYAEKFRDEHQYILAENKYDELLTWYPLDKKGVLDYAAMEKNYLRNYEKADRLVRTNILDYKTDDPEGLLALGDINLDWGEVDPDRYEYAREAYARYINAYGQSNPIMERMLKYFIRTDKLADVLPLQEYFMRNKRSIISAATLAELGGYLLDKHFEKTKGVPDENIERIGGIKDILLRSVESDPSLPESHFHLARYYHNYGATLEERHTLQNAASAFDLAEIESPKRTGYRIDTQQRLADLMIRRREFLPAEETLEKGISIYENAVDRRILFPQAKYGMLYASLGDLEYFTKSVDTGNGSRAPDWEQVLAFYLMAERNGYAPPEIQYRLGSTYYRMGDYENAQNRFWNVFTEVPYNRRLLNAMGNVSYLNSEYHAAQGYYKKLLDILESDRNRFPVLLPNDRPEHKELVERMMYAHNNLGVTLNALAARTGNPSYRAQALGELTESARIWDNVTRDPETMVRSSGVVPGMSGATLPNLNIQNTLYPVSGGAGQLSMQIDKDVNEPSMWEELMAGADF